MPRTYDPGEQLERDRVEHVMRQENAVFVLGSNRAGLHGGGAAREALHRFGARWRLAEGHAGRSYALPTMNEDIEPLPIDQIAGHVSRFLEFARLHPELVFAITRIGCGICGYEDADVAPLFADAPENCELPIGWRRHLAAAE